MKAALLQDFVHQVRERGLEVHGVAVQQHGRLLEEYRWIEDLPHILHSLSKSFTATAVGMAVEEGRFRLDDRVVDFFPEEAPREVSPYLEELTVRDLLIMAPGRAGSLMLQKQRDAIPNPNWVEYYLGEPLTCRPGTYFAYDTGCTYMLSALIQKTTGVKLVDYLQPRLFIPFGYEEKPRWEECPRGIDLGGAGLWLRTTQLLPLGQLYLQQGQWEGGQILTQEWVREATSKQIDTAVIQTSRDNVCGYGYQFWICHNGAYRGDGAYAQFCIVLPWLDAVIAVNSQERRAQEVLDVIWATILPKLEEG